ncbi:fic family toxin-antitoxin system, toxin component [Streptomyces sp. NPDC003077]|uniref:fic family toxin-antitoxin system, toxin component n=1 Tax=Streptomyces sp. NPDC003077 TaxID=3154443 RepID=UPI00339EE29B
MTVHHIDARQLLWAARRLPGAPGVHDHGALIAAAHRTTAEVFRNEVYDSAPLKAAALLQTLVLLRPLEHGNRMLGFGAARAFLAANGLHIRPRPDELRALLASVEPGAAGVRAVAERLTRWARPEAP